MTPNDMLAGRQPEIHAERDPTVKYWKGQARARFRRTWMVVANQEAHCVESLAG